MKTEITLEMLTKAVGSKQANELNASFPVGDPIRQIIFGAWYAPSNYSHEGAIQAALGGCHEDFADAL